MISDSTPVLVGAGEITVRDEPLDALSRPLDLMQAAALGAREDSGANPNVLAELDDIVVVKAFREPTRNSAESLARRLGATHARPWLAPDGGQAPQTLVNHFAQRIASGQSGWVLLTGAEAMDNARRLIKSGHKPEWAEPADNDARFIYPDAPMNTTHESDHGIWRANHVYPLFENALRGHYAMGLDEYQQELGRLFESFARVAASHPGAWFPVARSAEEIADPSGRNRYVAYPHTKFMNAMNQINQGAALLLTSVGRARDAGVPESRLLYLHACADTHEHGFMSERVNYYSSPALRVLGEQAMKMAGRGIDDMAFIDIYSCFPCAVAIARDELGIARDDSRPLTVTGGLPFHGGAGNSYSMNAIATMAGKLRESPGSFGLVTANGGYLSKHSAGVYSTDPVQGTWQRPDPSAYQAAIDTLPAPELVMEPEGPAHIETYTVTFGRDGQPERGIVIGRLGTDDNPKAARFLANLPDDPALLASVTDTDFLNLAGTVARCGTLNVFTPG